MEEVLPELKEFIAGYCDKYRITKVDPDKLTVDTSIDLDLDIFDIEIDLFLAEFADTFRIDSSRFTWYKYGYPKGSMSVEVIKTVFGYRYGWVKKVAHKIYKPKFFSILTLPAFFNLSYLRTIDSQFLYYRYCNRHRFQNSLNVYLLP